MCMLGCMQDLSLQPALASQLHASVFELYRLRVELNELLPDLVVSCVV